MSECHDIVLCDEQISSDDNERLCLREFFHAAIHSVLYVRNVYPQGAFETYRIYNLPIKVCVHPGVVSYIEDTLDGIENLQNVAANSVAQLIVTIASNERDQGVERFVFDMNDELDDDEPSYEDILNLEQGFREILIKLYQCNSEFKYRSEDIRWFVEIKTKQSIFVESQEEQLIHDTAWMETDLELGSFGNGIFPLTSFFHSQFQVQLYLERSPEFLTFNNLAASGEA